MLFGSVSAIAAVDGGGKGAMATVIALSMITGKPLLGEKVWRKGPVAIITYEDDEAEWQRRIAAACLHYGIPFEEVIGQFHFIKPNPPSPRIRFATLDTGHKLLCPDGDYVIRKVRDAKAALLIIDPFNSCHELPDGNANVAMSLVAQEITRVAREADAAVLVLHHLRKGASGEPDDFMGATSVRATFRSSRIFARMTLSEASKLKLEPRESWRYLRHSGSKLNYAPPPDLIRWFELKSVDLGNGTPEYPEGDNVQVMARWQPDDPLMKASADAMEAVIEAIRDGVGDGEFYSPDARSDCYAAPMVASITGLDEGDAKRLLEKLRADGVLVVGSYQSRAKKHEVKRLSVGEDKAKDLIEFLKGAESVLSD